MALNSSTDPISRILSKPNPTSDDLQEIFNYWHNDLLNNEKHLIQCAEKLESQQRSINETTKSIVELQNLFPDIEKDLNEFESLINSFHKYNDELEKRIEDLNVESKKLLPNSLVDPKTEQDRLKMYELMDSVDDRMTCLQKDVDEINNKLRLDTDKSILKTVDALETCLHDICDIKESIKQLKS